MLDSNETNVRAVEGSTPNQQDLALQAVLHAEGARLLAYIRKQMPADLNNFVDAPDVLQDTFFEACQRIGEFTPQGNDAPFRWLVTIARHRILALLRMQRARKRGGVRQNDEFGRLAEVLDQLAIYERTPSKSAMVHELAVAIHRTMSHLEPQYEEAIRLRYIDGLSIKETSNRMQRTEGAVLMLCNRGLKALKLELQSASIYI